ncbi:MAG: hypothetical protein V4681_03250 [Patescibacteria group bacterium]
MAEMYDFRKERAMRQPVAETTKEDVALDINHRQTMLAELRRLHEEHPTQWSERALARAEEITEKYTETEMVQLINDSTPQQWNDNPVFYDTLVRKLSTPLPPR